MAKSSKKRSSSSSVPAKATTTAVAHKPKDPLVDELYSMENEIKKALQGAMPPERFIRLALSEYRAKPDIRKTSRESRLLAILQAAQAGLEIGGVFGECGLTPYSTECKLSIYYPGLIKAATNARRISQPTAIPVYENEQYAFDKEICCNAPTEQLPPDERGENKVAAFAQFFFDGRRVGEWLWKQDVEAIRACSQGYRAFKAGKIKSTPWVGDFEDEMWKLAALRRLLKRTPKAAGDHRLMAAIEAHNMEYDFSQMAPPTGGAARPAVNGNSLRGALGMKEAPADAAPEAPAEEMPTEKETPPEAEAPAQATEEFVPRCNSCDSILEDAGMYHGKCPTPGCEMEGIKVKI